MDEAHSSQTGRNATKLKEGLGNTKEILEEYARQELKDENKNLDEQDLLLKELASNEGTLICHSLLLLQHLKRKLYKYLELNKLMVLINLFTHILCNKQLKKVLF